MNIRKEHLNQLEVNEGVLVITKSENWTPTNYLRYKVFLHIKELQQLWYSDEGKQEWREIPTYEE